MLQSFVNSLSRQLTLLSHSQNCKHFNFNNNNLKKHTLFMTTSTFINLTSILGQITLSDVRARVLASGAALVIVYAINFLFQLLVMIFKKENRPATLRKLMQTSQVLYWFGVASIFSIYPPFYYGGFNAVIAYLTLIFVFLMHLFCLFEKQVSGRSVWSVFYFFYHLLIMIWIIVGLILAYIWTDTASKGG